MLATTLELDKYRTVMDIVHSYQQAQKAIIAAYGLLAEAYQALEGAAEYYSVMPSGYSPSGRDAARNIDEVMGNVKSGVWRSILSKTHAPEFMTPSRLKTFQEALDKPDELPEITPETIRDFVENVLNKAPDMLTEFIKETFDWLQPGGWGLHQYKTNQKSQYELQDKVIKTIACERKWNGKGVQLSYYTRDKVQAMDNAFHLMDGKGISKYPGNAITLIQEAHNNDLMQCETDYFQFKFFLNQNIHIKFKRMDLVARMNQIAGENLVKPVH